MVTAGPEDCTSGESCCDSDLYQVTPSPERRDRGQKCTVLIPAPRRQSTKRPQFSRRLLDHLRYDGLSSLTVDILNTQLGCESSRKTPVVSMPFHSQYLPQLFDSSLPMSISKLFLTWAGTDVSLAPCLACVSLEKPAQSSGPLRLKTLLKNLCLWLSVLIASGEGVFSWAVVWPCGIAGSLSRLARHNNVADSKKSCTSCCGNTGDRVVHHLRTQVLRYIVPNEVERLRPP